MIRFVTDTKRGLFRIATKGQEDLAQATAQGLAEGSSLYARGRLKPVSVADRFKPEAFATHGYTHRSWPYQRRQIKVHGIATPFRSPRRLSILRVLEAAARPSTGAFIAAARDLANQTQMPMRNRVTIPGVGHRVTVRGKRRLVVRISWPGANILNREKNPRHREEWRDLQRGGAVRAIHRYAGLRVKAILSKKWSRKP